MNLLACARFEMNTLESTEGNVRRTFHVREFEVDLDHFISAGFASVGDRHIGVYRLARSNNLRRDTEVTVAERCVAEPVPERIERLALEVPIGPISHTVIFKVW